MVITVQMSYLREAICGPITLARASTLFVGRFQTIGDVSSFVEGELRRITGIWIPYRRASESRVLYRVAILVVQREIRKLGDDPDLAHFLRAGVALIDWPDVRQACEQITAVVNINIDAETDRQLIACVQPLHFPALGAMRDRLAAAALCETARKKRKLVERGVVARVIESDTRERDR